MAATSRKWILIVISLNIAMSLLFGNGWLDNSVLNEETPTYNSGIFGMTNITDNYAKQDGLYSTETTNVITYMPTGTNPVWFMGKIIGLFLFGVPIAALVFTSYGISYGLTSPIGIISTSLGLVFGILTVYFIMAMWFLIFKPKSD